MIKEITTMILNHYWSFLAITLISGFVFANLLASILKLDNNLIVATVIGLAGGSALAYSFCQTDTEE